MKNNLGEEQFGTRCAVCTQCGRCFDVKPEGEPQWTGVRCEVCTGCGKCMEAWGLLEDDEDGSSGPTNWADAFKVMDDGNRGAPPSLPGAPGVS